MFFYLKQNNHSTEICDYSTFLWWEIEQYLFCSCNTTLHVWSRDVPGCQCSNITFGKQFVYPDLSAMVLGNSPSSAVTPHAAHLGCVPEFLCGRFIRAVLPAQTAGLLLGLLVCTTLYNLSLT